MRLLAMIVFVTVAASGPVIAQQEPAPDSTDATLEQMQLLIHHAVATAAEGGRLVLVGGGTGTSSEIDVLAGNRGKALIAEAKDLIREVTAGDAMMRLHAVELSDSENARMISTHLLEQAASNYIAALEQSLGPPAGEATSETDENDGDDDRPSR